MTVEDLMLKAAVIGSEFWTAIGRDDDAAALLSTTWSGFPREGFARAYRIERRLVRETCLVMGLFSEGELLAADRLRL